MVKWDIFGTNYYVANRLLSACEFAVFLQHVFFGLHPVALVVFAQSGVVQFVLLVEVLQQVLLYGGVPWDASGDMGVENLVARCLLDELVGKAGESRLVALRDGEPALAAVPVCEHDLDFGVADESLWRFLRVRLTGQSCTEEVVEEMPAQVVCTSRFGEVAVKVTEYGRVYSDTDFLCSVLSHNLKKNWLLPIHHIFPVVKQDKAVILLILLSFNNI